MEKALAETVVVGDERGYAMPVVDDVRSLVHAKVLPKLDSKRKKRVAALAQLMDISPSTVVQVAVDRLFQSQTTKGRIQNNGNQ